jgi:ketosteroid isomerase-like protein
MGHNNLQIAQSLYDGYASGNIAPLFTLLDPEIEVHIPDSLPQGGFYRGLEGAKQFILRLKEVWEVSHSTVERLVDGGDQVIAFLRLTGKLRGSDQQIDTQTIEVLDLRDGKVVGIRVFYWDTAPVVKAWADRATPT